MIVKGTVRCVHKRLGCPIDRLLYEYYRKELESEIDASYLGILPSTEDAFKIIESYVENKYPFLSKDAKKDDIVDRYNKAKEMAERLSKIKAGKNSGQ